MNATTTEFYKGIRKFGIPASRALVGAKLLGRLHKVCNGDLEWVAQSVKTCTPLQLVRLTEVTTLYRVDDATHDS